MRPARRPLGPLALALCLALFPLAARAADPAPLGRLDFLIGEWTAEGGGKPGEAGGGFSFASDLQGKVLVRRSHADYPAANGRPASRHDDLMVIYAEGDSSIRTDYFDSEGHVIRYTAQPATGPGKVVFVSETLPSAPRFRLTYELNAAGALAGRFEVAPPGNPEGFSPYLTWTAHKVPAAR